MHRRLVCAAAAAFTIAQGCSVFTTGDKCTAVGQTALAVTVVDSASGTPIGASTRFIVVHQGVHTDTLTSSAAASSDAKAYYFFSDPGLYDLSIDKPGYVSWSRQNIRVLSQDCMAQTVSLVVKLQHE